MPIVCEKYRIAYFNIPKVASTTLKLAFYELEHGRPFDGPDPEVAIHHHFPTPTFDVERDLDRYADYWRISILRDPVARLLSAYGNRITHARDTYKGRLARTRAWALGLPMDPDPDTFFCRLGRYRLQSGSIRKHTRPMTDFLGRDTHRYDRIYRIEDMAELADDLRARTGRPVTLPRTQTGGRKLTLHDVSRASYDALLDLTRTDYDAFRDYYSPPPWKAA